MRYFLHPGKIKSETDGQVHYISCSQLAKYYGLNIKECHLIFDESNLIGIINEPGDCHLYPLEDGSYREVMANIEKNKF